MIVFDIETRPIPIDQLKLVLPPFESPEPPGEFDPEAVKYGNTKDPDKRAVKLAEAKAAHEKAVAKFTSSLQAKEQAYWAEHYGKAALSAETATVCAIGITNDRGAVAIDLDLELNEEQMLRRFWGKISDCLASRPQRKVVGFNSNRFDIPFLVRRSWYIDVEVPKGLFTPTGYLQPVFIDLMQIWQCGDRRSYVSLDRACRAAGLSCKPEEIDGAHFHEQLSNEQTRQRAVDYLKNDLVMTSGLARRLGVL